MEIGPHLCQLCYGNTPVRRVNWIVGDGGEGLEVGRLIRVITVAQPSAIKLANNSNNAGNKFHLTTSLWKHCAEQDSKE